MVGCRVLHWIIIAIVAVLTSAAVALVSAALVTPVLSTTPQHQAWSTVRTSTDGRWQIWTQRHWATTRVYLLRQANEDVEPRPVPDDRLPAWSGITAFPRVTVWAETWQSVTDLGHGWPFVAIWHVYSDEFTRWPEDGGSLAVGSWHLPARIWWPGLVLDILFYGALLWLAWSLARTLRRRLRAWAGRCPACGYTLHQAMRCSECGHAERSL